MRGWDCCVARPFYIACFRLPYRWALPGWQLLVARPASPPVMSCMNDRSHALSTVGAHRWPQLHCCAGQKVFSSSQQHRTLSCQVGPACAELFWWPARCSAAHWFGCFHPMCCMLARSQTCMEHHRSTWRLGRQTGMIVSTNGSCPGGRLAVGQRCGALAVWLGRWLGC